jgi:hypothetical protein
MFSGLPPLEQQGLLFALIGLTAFLFGGRGMWARREWEAGVRVGGAAVGFFGVPIVVAEYAGASLPTTSGAALFAMVPIVVVTVLAASDVVSRDEQGPRRFLVPALLGLGGLLLLLPLQFSNSGRGWIVLGITVAAVVLVGLASVWLYTLLRGFALAEALTVVGLANALFLLAWSGIHEHIVWRGAELRSLLSFGSLVDAVEVLLIVWLLREMSPIRFAARYFVIPLLTVLESFVLMRPESTVRIWSGTALLAAGAGLLLFWKSGEEESILSLR